MSFLNNAIINKTVKVSYSFFKEKNIFYKMQNMKICVYNLNKL